MLLKRLTLKGFKSFAQPTQLTFDQGVTAIVGPNGSGKSNVADAIKWAIGTSGAKQLRSKRGADVIFAGSAKAKRLGMAEVEMVFDNTDRKLDIDFAEVAIKRRIHQNGDTETFINGQSVKLADVHVLLAKAGVSTRSYSIIGQGTIDRLIQASPLERKQMFDDAAGIRPLQLKKERSEHSLEQTQQNIVNIKNLVHEIQPRLKTLEKQSEKAAAKDEVAAKLKETQELWYRHAIATMEHAYAATTARRDKERKMMQEQEHTLDQLQKKVYKIERTELGADHALVRARAAVFALEDKLARTKKDLAAISGSIEREEQRSQSTDVANLLLTQTEQKKALDAATREYEKNAAPLAKFRTRVAHLQKEFAATEARLAKITTALEAARASYTTKDIRGFTTSFEDSFRRLNDAVDNQSWQHAQQLLRDMRSFWTRIVAVIHKDDREQHLVALQQEHQTVSHQSNQAREKLTQATIQLATLEAQTRFAKDQLDACAQAYATTVVALKEAKSTTTPAALQRLHKQRDALLQQQTQHQKELDTAQATLRAEQERDTREKQDALKDAQALRQHHEGLLALQTTLAQTEVAWARLDAERNALHNDLVRDLGTHALQELSKNLPKQPDDATTQAKRKQTIERLLRQQEQIGAIDPLVMQEYQEVSERYVYLTGQLEDLEKTRTTLREVIVKLETTIEKQFHQAFASIGTAFEKFFRILFNGGHAKLYLKTVTPEPDEEGNMPDTPPQQVIEIKALPPGKKLKSLSVLSGGEKALTSLALLYAIIANNPSPFIVLDEVDAALDEANARRFAKVLRTLEDKTQCIMITHNRETMQQAKVIYGVTMNEKGMSHLLSLRMEQATKLTRN